MIHVLELRKQKKCLHVASAEMYTLRRQPGDQVHTLSLKGLHSICYFSHKTVTSAVIILLNTENQASSVEGVVRWSSESHRFPDSLLPSTPRQSTCLRVPSPIKKKTLTTVPRFCSALHGDPAGASCTDGIGCHRKTPHDTEKERKKEKEKNNNSVHSRFSSLLEIQ